MLMGFEEGTEIKTCDQCYIRKWKFPILTCSVPLRVTKVEGNKGFSFK